MDHSHDYQVRMDAHISYGLFAPDGKILLLPYSGMTVSGNRIYRLGMRWQRSERFDVNLFGEQRYASRGEHRLVAPSC